MQDRSTIFAVLTMLATTVPSAGIARTPDVQCDISPQQGWREFVDRSVGFCFWYPNTYHLRSSALTAGSQPVRQALATFESRVPRLASPNDKEDAEIEVWLLPGVINLEELVKGAPTDVITPPSPIHLGANTSYHYGPGGGGVAYSDRYFLDLNGRTLEVIFDGPYAGKSKSPIARTQAIEKTLLSSFRAERR